MLDLRRLALLRDLEARGSIAAVSQAVGISSSAISQQLTKLEADVGMRLLEPVGRSVRLTTVGKELAARADQLIAILEETEAELESRRSRVQGIVRFAAFSTFALRYLPEILRRTALSHPDVVVEFFQLEPSEALDAVAGRRADIAVTDEYQDIPRRSDARMTRTHLLRDQITVYAPTQVGSIADLVAVPWVFEPAGTDAAAWAIRVCREAGFEPRIQFESPDLRVHHGLAHAGAAAAFLPQMLFDSPTAALPEPLYPLETNPLGLHRDVYAVTRRGTSRRPSLAAFLTHLRHVTAA